jgi:hypothetical protein
VSYRETQRLDHEARLYAKEMGCCDALDGLPPDPDPTTFLEDRSPFREHHSCYRVMLAFEGYAEGYAEGSEPLPF